jgi:hypothetical protein
MKSNSCKKPLIRKTSERFLTECRYGFNVDNSITCTHPFDSGHYRTLASKNIICSMVENMHSCKYFEPQEFIEGNEYGQQKRRT